jgi:nitrogen fixation/metabolism regulation signal transduction histidine kinase
MFGKRFHINLIIRIFLIVANSILFASFTHNLKSEYLFISINLFVLIIIQAFLFYRFLNTSNKEVSRIFSAISNDDFSQISVSNLDEKFSNEFRNYLSLLNQNIRSKSFELNKQKLFIDLVFKNIKTGLFVYTNSGKVELFNNAANTTLNINENSSIEGLSQLDNSLSSFIKNLKPEESKIFKLKIKGNLGMVELIDFSFTKTIFSIENERINLIAFNNIKNELDNKEMESWLQLIRVLTHEIMNSITPVTTLSKSINSSLLSDSGEIIKLEDITTDILEQTINGLRTIEGTSTSLMNFIENYRDLTYMHTPNFKRFSLEILLKNIYNLFESDFDKQDIVFSYQISPENFEIQADIAMIQQILVNLIKNAIEAVSSKQEKVIKLDAFVDLEGKTIIQISDNGTGFSDAVKEKLFIPFFSTKEGGSGIGLSLSKQIIRKHGGDLLAHSIPNEKTVFTILL